MFGSAFFGFPNKVGKNVVGKQPQREIRIAFSGRDLRTTRNQESRLQQLRAAGAEIRGSRTRLHAKWLLADDVVVVGSSNFTHASSTNIERNAVITNMSRNQLDEEISFFQEVWDASAPFTDGLGTHLFQTPPRR